MSATYSVRGDWGTTRLRLFRVVDGAVVERVEGPGIGSGVAPAQALRDTLQDWRVHGQPERIVLCGMAGARTGLAEAPYVECPADAAAWARAARRLEFDGVPVAIAAGLACRHGDGTPDVMRGEEAQVFGALRQDPALSRGRHVFVLPGTHGKWAELDEGSVTAFRTFPSGELFALLCAHSTLARGDGSDDADSAGFHAGLAASRTGGGLLSKLFRARAAQMREARTPGWAQGYLSGLILGSEVADALAGLPGVDTVHVVGDTRLTARYLVVLAAHGVAAVVHDGDQCVLSGLARFEEALQ